MLAPIALFVYARPSHTRRTLEALAKNRLASESELFIFCDGARHEDDLDNVAETRRVARDAKGFKNVYLIEYDFNRGLAGSIIAGLNQLTRDFGSVIVLEDDILTAPNFIEFMNMGLERYRDTKGVWHINGWNYPVEQTELPNTYFWRVMHCWGWATWSDRWAYFTKNPKELVETWSTNDIDRFNLDGTYNFWGQVLANQSGAINTWAVFWYATIFKNAGLCLSPAYSMTQNIGLDGSGQNCANSQVYDTKIYKYFEPKWPDELVESKAAIDFAKKYNQKINRNKYIRIFNKIKSLTIKFIT